MNVTKLPDPREQPPARFPGRRTEPLPLEATSSELLTTLSARALEGKHVVFAGHGLPTLAVSLAQRTVSPGVEIIYESGVTGAQPADLPRSISDSVLVTGAAGVLPMAQLFNFVLQGQRVDVGFLGAAQVDKFGSLNSSLIGKDWDAPVTKLPGSGGAIEAMAGAGEVFVVMRRHNPRSLVEDLDFCTTPGPRRAAAGRGGVMPAGLGVTTVITDLGIMTRRGIDEELVLSAVHPGVEVDDVRAATEWDLQVSENLVTTVPPTGWELALLRDVLDPERVYLR
ncbi:3-oxoadipate--succinyl-CoA transferase subunit B [Pseudarthrobacter sp. MDT3-26]|uniref:CoA-transferase subunit beta n=1 Tax=Pseudarthrobacter raffinosi TaxID=2953651 RepID=UPI00208F15E8|nr:CoA-transferase [Pseudarthrobacter sp. MDT3-26]MCO4264774.1 3-oxoadipate--succinyl-CoA transferase subunit B [Pseudarthrobacter sp. MDT3-26]